MSSRKRRISTEQLRVRGEVVEILPGPGAPVAKIFLKSCSIELPLGPRTDLHLGDCVEVEAELRIRSVKPGSLQTNSRR